MMLPYENMYLNYFDKEFFKPEPLTAEAEEDCNCCRCWVAKRTGHYRH